jgi:hypothetical protein
VNRPFALPILLACAAASACSQPGPVAKGAKNTVAITPTRQPVPHANATGAPPANRAEMQPPPVPDAGKPPRELPAALRGRWGLTPMDCTSTRGDAKGLLVIGPSELRFYESRAVPTGDVQADQRSASGTFHFTGEGQSWAKYESLLLQKDLLIRTESNPTASFTYAKCS